MVSRSGIWFFSAVFIVLLLVPTVPLHATKGFQIQTAPPEYPTGVGPFFIITADTRKIGRKDLIVSNPDIGNNGSGGGTTIDVLLSNGDGTYQPAVSYTVGNTPIGIAAADFNGDGFVDLAVANAGSNTVSILINKADGTGTFNSATSIPVGANPVGPFAADLNGDGKMDLVVTNSDLFGADSCASSSISILLGNGNGTFTTKPVVHAGSCPLDAGIVNLGNGKLDLVVVNNGGMNSTSTSNISVLIGNGAGGFGAATNYAVGSRPSFAAIADFNGDGKPDVAVECQGAKGTGANSGIYLLLGNGNGTLQTATTIPGTNPRGIVAGDFNNDGKMDLASNNNQSGSLDVFLGNGNGTFQSPKSFPLSNTNDYLLAADVNGDGKLDIVEPIDNSPSPGALAVLLGKGDGSFAGGINTYSFNANAQDISVADFNGDGIPDLAVGLTAFNGCNPTCTSAGFVEALLGAGDGSFVQGSPVSVPGNGNGVTTGVFKTGGHQDIVVSQNSQAGNGFFSYIAGNGNGTFQNPVNTTLGINPFMVASADFNKDGKLDIAMGNCGGLAYFLGAGNGSFGSQNNLSANGFCVGGQVATGDLNGDGYPDMVVTNVNGGTLIAYVYLNNGAGGGFSGPTAYSIAPGPANFQPLGVALGHFKESTSAGHLDIALTNPVTNVVTILTNNGDGTFTLGNSYATGTNPVYINAGNFDGSGHTSLVVANCTNCNMSNGAGSTVSVLYGNGDGTFQPQVSYVGGAGSDAVGVGDFNGDGAPDLAVANGNGGTVEILLNTGGTFATLGSSANPSIAGQSVTFTALFTPSLSATATTGTVTFKDSNTVLGSPAISGNQAVFSTSTLSAGTHSITAVYSGDGNYNPHTSTAVSQVVNPAVSNTVLNASPNPADVNQPVNLTATVSGGGLTPTGQVTFKDGATTIGSAVTLTAGVANLSTPFGLPAATHSLTAVYSGDANYAGGTSNTVNEVVQLAPTNTAISSGANPTTTSTPVIFTATVTTGFGTPAGTVNFTATGPGTVTPSNGNGLNISGMATGSLTFPNPGSYSVTATYSGDADHAGSASSPLTEIVNCVGCNNTSTAIQSVAVAPPRAGEPLDTVELRQTATFNIVVTDTTTTFAPTGSVQLQDNGLNIGSPQPLTPGASNSSTASITVSELTLGSHSITAVYGGAFGTPPTFNPSSSTALPFKHAPRPH